MNNTALIKTMSLVSQEAFDLKQNINSVERMKRFPEYRPIQISDEQWELLDKQLDAMKAYYTILLERIVGLSKEITND